MAQAFVSVVYYDEFLGATEPESNIFLVNHYLSVVSFIYTEKMIIHVQSWILRR